MEGYFTLKFLFATEIFFFFFFFARLFLLGGSSVKKLTELYDLTKLLCFGLCPVPIIHQKFFPSLCESCNYDGLIVILG